MNDKFTAQSPLGYTVVCSNETWYNHIIPAEGHPIMQDNIDNVISSLEDPDQVYLSSQSPKRDIYFKQTSYKIYGKEKTMYTKVVVENNMYSSEVKSAWPQKTISGGIGGVIYDKSKL